MWKLQAFGDGCGEVLIVGDRDCTLQRRHQKVIEECPAPNLPPAVREALHSQARSLLARVGYRMAGTVEFLYDAETRRFYFLEVNTRPAGGARRDGVRLRRRSRRMDAAAGGGVAAAPPGTRVQSLPAMRCRPGSMRKIRTTPSARRRAMSPTPHSPRGRDCGWIPGCAPAPASRRTSIPCWPSSSVTRERARDALDALSAALRDSSVYGIETNLDYLAQALTLAAFREARMTTASLDALDYAPASFDVLEGGASTTVQSWPGRQGYWNVGVPPSGPMDDLSFRLGNRLLGNASDARRPRDRRPGAAASIQYRRHLRDRGTRLRSGCRRRAGRAVVNVRHRPRADTTHRGGSRGGVRAYLLVAGGIDVPAVMGSTATFSLGGIGGFNGRALRAGGHAAYPRGERGIGGVVGGPASRL